MNKIKLPSLFLLLAVVAGMCVFEPMLNAQQDSPAAQQRQPDTQSQSQAMNMASDSQTFSGKVAKADGQFVLQDPVTKATYVLDDQSKAKNFEGKEVKVNGTLDAESKTIHVSSIAPES